MNNVIISRRILAGVLISILFSCNAFCTEPERRLTGFDHLLKVAGNEHADFDTGKISGILDHIIGNNSPNVKPESPSVLENATFACYGFDVDVDMIRLLKYAFNPDIPACAVTPSEIRLSSWTDLNGKKISITPPLWNRLNDDQPPVVIHGMSYVQNTPESGTGAYFGYASFKSVILLKYREHNILISIMKQKDVSEVGKKGIVMGPKDEPEYFYSGETGLAIRGLGWIRSYVYDSFSVSVYIERKEHEKGLKCAIFKWIRGGWAGNNMIRESHVRKGIERYFNEFKYIMELKEFPSPEELADQWAMINTLHHDDLKKRAENHILTLKGKCPLSQSCPRIFKSDADFDNYMNRMSHLEMSSVLITDYVKQILVKSEKHGKIASGPVSAGSKTN